MPTCRVVATTARFECGSAIRVAWTCRAEAVPASSARAVLRMFRRTPCSLLPRRRPKPVPTVSTHRVPRGHLVDPENRTAATYGEHWTGPGFLLDGAHVRGFTAPVPDRLLDELEWSRPWDTSRRHRVTEDRQ